MLGGFPVARDHIELMLLGVVGLSFVPVAIELLKDRRARQRGC
ncbi:MAG TPA: hypothetical protein VFA63_15710 [Pseudonocardiaceae bacterium]|nr:hypothetical protein [Pseudonocardiaceae bacterium]